MPLMSNVRRHNPTQPMRALLGLPLVLALAACSDTSVAPGTPSGPALADALQGAWCVSDDEGKSCWGWDVFLDQQTIEACGRFPEDGRAFRARAKFTVEGTTACYEITESNHPTAFPIGHRFCATVLEINGEYQRYKMSGVTEKTYRTTTASVKCPSDA
jgi:hypothetical protein